MLHAQSFRADEVGGTAAAITRLAAGFVTHDWMCCLGFLSPARAASLRQEAESLRAAGGFHPAGIGKGGERRTGIRGDEVMWVDAGTAPLAEALQREELTALREAINAATYLGLRDFEGHYAVYPAGAAYARHVDRFRDDDRRVVSLVLYLNDAWEAGDGGELCLYAAAGDAAPAAKLLPAAGTLACFLSERVPHEVLPARRTRLSFTGWFRRA